MESFQQQINNKNVARRRVARLYKKAFPVSIEQAPCTDAGSQVEKDGTGIGTGTDKER